MKRILIIATKDIAITITCVPFFFLVTSNVSQSMWCGLIVFLETIFMGWIIDYQLTKKERGIKRRIIIVVEYMYISIGSTAFFAIFVVTNSDSQPLWCGVIVFLVALFEGCIIDHQLMKKESD